MKRCFAIVVLSVFLITYFLPVATLVKADVVIGDNNDIIVNEDAKILGRKLAVMESLSDVLLNGATEITITNSNDLDSYLDYLWNEVDNAIDSLSNPDNWENLSNELRIQYLNSVVSYQNYIENRGGELSFHFNNPTDSYLSTYLTGNTLGKGTYQKHEITLPMLKALSVVNNDNSVTIPNEYQSLIDIINKREDSPNRFWLPFHKNYSNSYYDGLDIGNYTWFSFNGTFQLNSFSGSNGTQTSYNFVNTPQNVYINKVSDNNYTCSFYWNGSLYTHYHPDTGGNYSRYSFYYNTSTDKLAFMSGTLYQRYINFNHSGTLTQIFNALKDEVKNVNIYVDNVLWSSVSAPILNPTLNIDGFLKVSGDENPPQYELQPNTKIDYDQLYQVIYNAIRDNLPISQGDINYYDSHDTIYSPTIINNYSNDPAGENDWIESILDYAIVPNFDTALVEPISEPITNGTVIMVTGVSVIPEDILFVLGAAFVLILFACIINRMIE